MFMQEIIAWINTYLKFATFPPNSLSLPVPAVDTHILIGMIFTLAFHHLLSPDTRHFCLVWLRLLDSNLLFFFCALKESSISSKSNAVAQHIWDILTISTSLYYREEASQRWQQKKCFKKLANNVTSALAEQPCKTIQEHTLQSPVKVLALTPGWLLFTVNVLGCTVPQWNTASWARSFRRSTPERGKQPV